MVTKLDFVGVPSTDADRSRKFYVETLGLRPDEKSDYEFWVGETCFGIWEPAKMGMEFASQTSSVGRVYRQMRQSQICPQRRLSVPERVDASQARRRKPARSGLDSWGAASWRADRPRSFTTANGWPKKG